MSQSAEGSQFYPPDPSLVLPLHPKAPEIPISLPEKPLHEQFSSYFNGEKIVIHRYEDVMIPSSYSNIMKMHLEEELAQIAYGLNVLDVGTGSGYLGILMAKSGANVVATDINEKAIEAALYNAEKNGVAKNFVALPVGNMLRQTLTPDRLNSFDFIICNPAQLPCPEPELSHKIDYAYWAGEHGRYMIKRLVQESGDFLKPDGLLVFTHTSLADFEKTQILLRDEGYDYKYSIPTVLPFREFYDKKYIKKLGGLNRLYFEPYPGKLVEQVLIFTARKVKENSGNYRRNGFFKG